METSSRYSILPPLAVAFNPLLDSQISQSSECTVSWAYNIGYDLTENQEHMSCGIY